MTMSDPLQYLPYIHILIPCLLLLPLLTLVPSRPPPITEPNGVRSITVRTIYPRTGLITLILCLLAFTSFLDSAVTVALLLGAESNGHKEAVEGLNLVGWLVYPVGEFVVWSLTAIVLVWRQRWQDRSLKLLGVVGWCGEVVDLVFLSIRVAHSGRYLSWPIHNF